MNIQGSTSTTSQPLTDVTLADHAPTPPEIPTAVAPMFNPTESLERSVKQLNRHLERGLVCSSGITRIAKELIAEGAEKVNLADFVEQTHAKRIRSEMWALQFRQCCAVMTHSQSAGRLDKSQLQPLNDEQSKSLHALRTHLEEKKPLEIAEALDATINSSNDFFEKLLELIDLIKNGYLAGYEHVISAYSDFFADFNAQITGMMKEWIEGVNDGKEVKLNAGALFAALTDLIAKYTHPNPDSVLFPKPGDDGVCRDEAENWRIALGLPPQCLKENADGTWCVVIDTGPLHRMKDGLPPSGTVTWDTAKFNAWQSGINAQEERMKNMLQSFTQKYSNANSYHDNFNKTLSAHLNQYADMLRAMLNF